MKVLVTGANGQLGKALKAGSNNHPELELLFTDIEDLDITSYDAVEKLILSFKPEALINCASYNAVDKAEDEPVEAMQINGNALQTLAGLARKHGFGLIHISSDYIFDGKKGSAYTELDEPHPQSKYALSKFIGEQAVHTAGPDAAIIRTSWLYSEYTHNFVKTIRKLAREKDELKVVCDQQGTPTYAGDLADAIFTILPGLNSFNGVRIYNFSSEGLTNWAEFAAAIIEYSGLDCKVTPVTTEEYGFSKAARPAFSLLDKSKIKKEFNISIPDWRVSLKKCIKELGKENQDMSDLNENVIKKAKAWLNGNIDAESKDAIRNMMENNPHELTESFYRDLEFGTGGLRGIMGVGTNRMNKYTVGMATQGLANYLRKVYGANNQIKVAIAYDSRNNSPEFARLTAEVFSANNIKVYLFDGLRPTPELSFAIRHYGCQSGVVITASHNPKEYNGYKAYWDDGAQLIPPHDKNVIEEVRMITNFDDVKFDGNQDLIQIIGEETDILYLDLLKKLSLSPEIIKQHHDIPIVYTPLHGTGATMVPWCLKNFGFTNISLVEEQAAPDGNFPTVKSPNPEESSAMEMAIAKAEREGASLVMATDPDADRVGIAVKDNHGKFILLNGNQTASVLLYYIFRKWKENGKITGKEYMVKTVVTTELLIDLANKYGIESYDVLTGFKWIADIIRKNEGSKTFIAGGEESYGYMIGDFVRDKDAVSSCAMIAEAAAWASSQDKTIFDILLDIYLEFGFYLEGLIAVVKKGMSGAEEIRKIMERFRSNPPAVINNSKVVMIKDYDLSIARDILKGTETPINLPKSNVLQFFLEDGSKISMRPSGTEPKIKFYFGVKAELNDIADYEMVRSQLENRIEKIIKDLNL